MLLMLMRDTKCYHERNNNRLLVKLNLAIKIHYIDFSEKGHFFTEFGIDFKIWK